MEYPKIIQLLLRRRKGDLSGEEKKTLDKWLKEKSSHREEAELYDKIWDLSGKYKEGYQPDTATGLERFRGRTQGESNAVSSSPSNRWWLILLLTALLALLGWIIWQRAQPSQPSGPVAVVTGLGERITVDLPDGSRVALNENSRLTHAGNWTADIAREVQLEGEAFFEVQPGASPFTVITPETEVQVLGTAFNIRAYAGESETAVTVEEGKVEFRLRNLEHALTLETSDKGICEHGGEMYAIQDAGVNASPWQSGVLRFRKTPMREVARSLQHYFGVVLDLSTSNVAGCTFTSPPLQEGELDQLVQTLEAVYEVRIERPASDTLRVYDGRDCSE